MSSEVRVRFAPSPTGNVHIGNIRAAIFNWLFARNQGGKFLLRVEDTDKERSTEEAVDTLLYCMKWLGLDYDEEIFYQSTQADQHIATAEKLISEGKAYKYQKGDGIVTLFRMPWDLENFTSAKLAGPAEQDLHTDLPVVINESGISFGLVSRKGKAIPQEQMCLAGFKDLKVFNEAGDCLLELNPVIGDVYSGEKSFELKGATKMTFSRHLIGFKDIVKGDLTKPLDSMKDLVIVKSDGSPLFHLANICDDITQNMTHIIRGDDHVENTYRHVLIYEALGHKPAQYAHLPMIVNAQGRPYGKRDGVAYVGEYKEQGYLAEALFNYLILLGWSPGDDKEKITRKEAIELFSLDRVKSTAAQMDINKLYNLNGHYLAEKPLGEFIDLAAEFAESCAWYQGNNDFFKKIAAHMFSRTKLAAQVESWSYYWTDEVEFVYETDEKGELTQAGNKFKNDVRKTFTKEGVIENLRFIANKLQVLSDFSAEALETVIGDASEECGAGKGRLNKAIRMAATALGGGAELFPTLEYIGKDKVVSRLRACADKDFSQD